jgi:ligand-binding sensor domain-containing protein/signal transduction histidine kinase
MTRPKPQHKPALALIALGTFIVLLCSPPVAALDPSLDLSQYAHTAWTSNNGFLHGAVYAIAQTADGYLWLGTQSGLFRFDGVRTMPLPLAPGQQLRTTEVGYLLPARDGTLWIGTLDGLVSWKDGHLSEHPEFRGRRVNALLQDRDGTIWVGTALGGPMGKLCAIRSGSTECYGHDGSLGAGVFSLYEDSDGSLWVGASSGVWRWKPGPPTRHSAASIIERQSLTQGDHGSGIIVATDGIRQIVGTRVIDYPVDGLPSPFNSAELLRDRNGGLWIGTRVRGLVRSFEGRTSLFTHKDGLSGDEVKALFEDREGTIWVGTSAGLDRFRELPVTSLSVEQGLSSAIATSVLAARDGSVWIGAPDGLNRWDHGRVTIYRMRSDPGLPCCGISSLYEDERGRIWVSGYRGLAVFEKGKFTAVPSMPVGSYFAIAGDNQGGLWLSLWFTAHDDGLAHLVNGKIVERVPEQKLGGGPALGLAPDPDGGIWAGLLTGGLAYFRNGQIRTLPLSDERAATRRLMSLSRDRAGTMWAATANGLSRIANGRVATLTTANGLPCDTVHWIIEDDSSSYWLYTQCGLLRIARTELDAWAADPKRTIQMTTFDATDGIRLIPVIRGFRPAVTKSSDGRIWFLNSDTLSVVDPSRIGINALPPPVHIERITADRKTYAARHGLRLPPLVHDLTIDYTALSLVAPEKVHFRFKLEGQDHDWREVVDKREVQYSNLPPRDYLFRVIASNNSGVWNDKGDTLDFSIAPQYYQTNWFRVSCAAAFLTLLWMAYQFRLRRLQREFNKAAEARVNERTRIARELHDTLLQSFQGLMFSFQAARNLLPGRIEEAIRTLDGAIRKGDDAIAEGRDAIQGLRANPEGARDLEYLLAAAGKELARSSRGEGEVPAFQFTVEGARQPLSPLLQDEVYLIAREILRNAFHHAQASRVEAEIAYDRQFFRLRIRDNGKGIDRRVLEEGARQGHWGLPGVRERAKRIGARLKLWSELGAGTEAELTVPARIAYGTVHRREGLRLFRGNKV